MRTGWCSLISAVVISANPLWESLWKIVQFKCQWFSSSYIFHEYVVVTFSYISYSKALFLVSFSWKPARKRRLTNCEFWRLCKGQWQQYLLTGSKIWSRCLLVNGKFQDFSGPWNNIFRRIRRTIPIQIPWVCQTICPALFKPKTGKYCLWLWTYKVWFCMAFITKIYNKMTFPTKISFAPCRTPSWTRRLVIRVLVCCV